jgi:hypothetical protein
LHTPHPCRCFVCTLISDCKVVHEKVNTVTIPGIIPSENMKPIILHEKNINLENYLSGTIFSDVAFSYITNQKKNLSCPQTP